MGYAAHVLLLSSSAVMAADLSSAEDLLLPASGNRLHSLRQPVGVVDASSSKLRRSSTLLRGLGGDEEEEYDPYKPVPNEPTGGETEPKEGEDNEAASNPLEPFIALIWATYDFVNCLQNQE